MNILAYDYPEHNPSLLQLDRSQTHQQGTRLASHFTPLAFPLMVGTSEIQMSNKAKIEVARRHLDYHAEFIRNQLDQRCTARIKYRP